MYPLDEGEHENNASCAIDKTGFLGCSMATLHIILPQLQVEYDIDKTDFLVCPFAILRIYIPASDVRKPRQLGGADFFLGNVVAPRVSL